MFYDRRDAGKQLAEKLAHHRGSEAVVLALPRGGVVVGDEIAKALHLPLDIVVTRKIGHPHNPEYAICVVDDIGTLLCNESERAAVPKHWLAKEIERQKEEAGRRNLLYRGGREPLRIKGKAAILVDDGIATGLTMQLAVKSVEAQKPRSILIAVPVAPADTIQELSKVADVVVLVPGDEFRGAVGAHYRQFEQVGDEEVIRILQN